MDGVQSLCAPMSLQISSSEPLPLCVARSHGCEACAKDKGQAGGAGDCALHALMGVGGSGASALQAIFRAAALTDTKGGAEVHGGYVDRKAGDPAPTALTVFPLGGAPQVLACINDVEFNDADLLATLAAFSFSRRRGRCYS